MKAVTTFGGAVDGQAHIKEEEVYFPHYMFILLSVLSIIVVVVSVAIIIRNWNNKKKKDWVKIILLSFITIISVILWFLSSK